MKTTVKVLITVCIIGIAVGKTPAAQEISASKLELINKVIDITRIKPQIQNYIDQIISMQNRRYAQILSKMQFTEKIDQEKIAEKRSRFSERFKELLSAELGAQDLIDKVYVPFYDKYFTENELKDLITFYKSPTGKKLLDVTPNLIKESIEKNQLIVGPKIREIFNQILSEEKITDIGF